MIKKDKDIFLTKSGILNKKALTVIIGIFFLVLVVVLLPRFLFRDRNQLEGTVPDNPASQVCQKISYSGEVYFCLAVVNGDGNFCQKIRSTDEGNECLALANKDMDFCRKIKDQENKEMCYYQLSFMLGNISYCDELDNWEQCYFSFIHRLHWQNRSDEIKAEYCEKFSKEAGLDLAFKDSCWAFKERDPSICQGNEHCLSFFPQPLSFCDNNPLKEKDDCLRDRALTAKDTSICEKITDGYYRDNCYSAYSAHIEPDLSLCEKISDQMTKNMCYREYAINISGR
jgi:hypothetical protein